jgi:hypothetical protein
MRRNASLCVGLRLCAFGRFGVLRVRCVSRSSEVVLERRGFGRGKIKGAATGGTKGRG